MDYWFNLIYEDRVINLKYVKEFCVQGKRINIIFKDGGLDSHEFATETDAKRWLTIVYQGLSKFNYMSMKGGNL